MAQRRKQHKFKLVDRVAVPVESVFEWAEYYEHADRQVAFDDLPDGQLSTVFLGLDSNFGTGAPRIFETAYFPKGEGVNVLSTYSTWEEAEKGHAAHLKNKTWTRGK